MQKQFWTFPNRVESLRTDPFLTDLLGVQLIILFLDRNIAKQLCLKRVTNNSWLTADKPVALVSK